MGQANCKGYSATSDNVISNNKEAVQIICDPAKKDRKGENSLKKENKNSFRSDLTTQSFEDGDDFDRTLSTVSTAPDRPKLERRESSYLSIPEENAIICDDRRYTFSSHLSKSNLNCDIEFHPKRRILDWASAFRRTDPRYRIMKYFNDAATLGIERMTSGDIKSVGHSESVSPILKWIKKSSCFTVWRPTSNDAIRKMILGEGVGKGLDIKGKSAKQGHLSGYVPFLQIHEEAHKTRIRTLPKKSAMRVFFQSKEGRDMAHEEVEKVLKNMQEGYYNAQMTLKNEDAPEEIRIEAMEKFMWEMIEPEILIKDEYAESKGIYGLELPERLFWEAFVMRKSIDRTTDSTYITGRPSLPPFQDMNFASVRLDHTSSTTKIEDKYDDTPPQAVVYQYSVDNHLDPRDMILAYEEKGTVRPVVSDFDCFLVGTREVSYSDPISEYQATLLEETLKRIENVLSEGLSDISWMEKWLNVLFKDPLPSYEMPRYGFGDPKTYSLMQKAVSRLAPVDGCVRHGAESFNYCYPQDLDDKYLVIGEHLKCNVGTSKVWAYVDVRGLQEILLQKIEDGFTFPINPKWVLCDDPGWGDVYDALMKSKATHVQSSLNCWYPGTIRDNIQRIREKYPDGFVYYPKSQIGESSRNFGGRRGSIKLKKVLEDKDANDSTAVMDLAMQKLKRRIMLQRAKRKVRTTMRAIAFIRRAELLVKERRERTTIERGEHALESKNTMYIKPDRSFTPSHILSAASISTCTTGYNLYNSTALSAAFN